MVLETEGNDGRQLRNWRGNGETVPAGWEGPLFSAIIIVLQCRRSETAAVPQCGVRRADGFWVLRRRVLGAGGVLHSLVSVSKTSGDS